MYLAGKCLVKKNTGQGVHVKELVRDNKGIFFRYSGMTLKKRLTIHVIQKMQNGTVIEKKNIKILSG